MSARENPERGQRDPPTRPVLFVNSASGGGRVAHAELAERARDRGIVVRIVGREERLTTLVDDAVADGADALGVAGGDGSLAVVAAAAQAHGLPFICVPAGTRNHFAADVRVDRHDPVGALDAFADGVEHRIDVTRVNGRLFLNNVSLGIYGDAVRRSTYRDAKVRTLLETARTVLGPSGAARKLHLVDDDERITHLLLAHGHRFGRREVAIPIAAVARVETDAVTLRLTKDEIGAMP
jgi:hypothetical protein